MKIITAILFIVVLPVVAGAQGTQGLNPAEMQNYMQLMQEMQECMAKIDRAEMAAFETRSQEFDAEIDQLCAEGKRDEAQKKAMAYSKELAAKPAVQQMKKCSEKVVSQMPEAEKSFMADPDFEKHHVCDEAKEE